MKKTTFVILFCLVSTVLFANRNLDSLLVELDASIADCQIYLDKKEAYIKELEDRRSEAHSPEQQIMLNNNIFNQYKYYKFEEALNVQNLNYALARELGDRDLMNDCDLYKFHLYIAYGIYGEAEEQLLRLLDEHKRRPLGELRYKELLEDQVRLFHFMCHSAPSRFHEGIYASRVQESISLLLDEVGSIDDLNYDVQYIILSRQKRWEEVAELIYRAKKNVRQSSYLYSSVLYWEAGLARRGGDADGYTRLLAEAVLSDVKGGVTLSPSSYFLAQDFLKRGDAMRAQSLIGFSLNNLTISKAVGNPRLTSIVNEINDGFVRDRQAYEKRLIRVNWSVAAMLLVMFGVIVSMFRSRRREQAARRELESNHKHLLELNHRMNELNGELSQANAVKEEYLGVFLGVRPFYLDKIDEFRSQVQKMLKAGKTTELAEFCRRYKVEEDNERLYREFDQMFLSIIPTFVDEFNALLREEARIYPRQGELSIELRIFALIRLGVKDSGQIARYLCYSDNTIYNYRSRVKNNSLGPREEFESEVAKIGLPTSD